MAPRLSTGRGRGRPRKITETVSTQTSPPMGDNRKAIEEAEAAQLLSFLAKLREKKGVVDKCKTTLKTAQDEFNEVIRLAKASSKNFTRERLIELLTDMSSPQLRRNLTESEMIRARFRRACGLPVGDEGSQQDLEDRMPETAKDQMHYRAIGYTMGLVGEDCKAPEGTPPQFLVDLEAGWKDGQAALGAAIKQASKQPPPPPPTPKTDEAEQSEYDRRAAERAERRARESLDAIGPKDGEEEAQGLADDDPAFMSEVIGTSEPAESV